MTSPWITNTFYLCRIRHWQLFAICNLFTFLRCVFGSFQQELLFAMTDKKKNNPLLAMSAGCIAGGIEATAVWPMEFIKVNTK